LLPKLLGFYFWVFLLKYRKIAIFIACLVKKGFYTEFENQDKKFKYPFGIYLQQSKLSKFK